MGSATYVYVLLNQGGTYVFRDRNGRSIENVARHGSNQNINGERVLESKSQIGKLRNSEILSDRTERGYINEKEEREN